MTKWPLKQARTWEIAPSLRMLIPFLVGIIISDQLIEMPFSISGLMLALMVLGILFALSAGYRRRNPVLDYLFSFCFLSFFILAGCSIYCLQDVHRIPRFDKEHKHQDLVVIAEDPRVGHSSTRYTIQFIAQTGPFPEVLTGRAILYLIGASTYDPPLGCGDTLLVPEHWESLRNNGNPFSPDLVRTQRRNHISFRQSIRWDELYVFGRANPHQHSFIDKTHSWCNQKLQAAMKDTAALGLLQAMLLGDESAFDPELRQAYARTGIIHIVSISGSHVAVMFMVVTGLLYWLKGSRGTWIRYLVGLVLVWLYIIIAGAPSSAVRSGFMFSIMALSVISGREAQSLNTLIIAALVILCGMPEWLFTVGFQLSFGAVLSILIFYKPIAHLWPVRNKLLRKIWQSIAVSLAAEILTAPLVIYYFHNFPLLFVVANLLSGVLIGFCALVGGMGILALSWYLPFAKALAYLVSKVIWVFDTCILYLQTLNPTALENIQISFLELLLVYLLITMISGFWIRKRKGALLPALGLATALLILFNRDRFQSLRQQRLIVYNNGRVADVELLKGDHFLGLAGSEAKSYNNRLAHTGFQAWKPGTEIRQAYFSLASQRILLLSDTSRNGYHDSLPADVLILARPVWRLKIESVLNAFHPGTIVLAVHPGQRILNSWQDSCAAHHIRLFDVYQSGAYLLNELE